MYQENETYVKMFGTNMSKACAEQWALSQNYYKTKQLSTGTLQKITVLMLSGLNGFTNSEQQKKGVETIVNSLAAEMGVKISNIQILRDPTSAINGAYVNDIDTLMLNIANIENETELLITIIHELRHAEQHKHIKYEHNSEFATRIKHGLENYTQPTGKIIKNARYFSNLVELDAEIIAYNFTKNILDQLQNVKVAEDQKLSQKIERAIFNYTNQEQLFNKKVQIAADAIETCSQGKELIKLIAQAYSKSLFSPKNFDHSNTTYEMSKTIVAQLDELISSANASQVIDFSENDLYALKKEIFKDVSSYELLRHIDDPFMQYIENLENRFENYDQLPYKQFVTKLRSQVAKPLETVVKKYNLPYTPGDYSSMLDSYLANYREITTQNLLSGKEYYEEEQLMQNIEMRCSDLTPKIKQLKDVNYFLEKVPLEVLQERAENFAITNKYSAAKWIIPNFVDVCKEQNNKNMLAKFFTVLDVPKPVWENYSMGKAYQLFKKHATKYVVEHLFDKNFDKIQEQVVAFCLDFGDVTVEKLNKELLAHPITKLKLMSLPKENGFKASKMLYELNWRGRYIKDILKPNKNKNEDRILE